MKINLSAFVFFLASICVFLSCQNETENWSHFRGDNLDGLAVGEAPVNWSETQNIVWKAPIKGNAWSSPVVWDDQIWLTSATRNGDSLFAVCLDFESGKILKQIDLFQPDTVQRIHGTNSYATPTPCIEEGFVYVHYGTYGTACIDTKNYKTVWIRKDMNCEHLQGAASSIILYKDLLFVHLEGTDVQDIYALNKHTGETVWKVGCPNEEVYHELQPVYRKAYQTPIVISVDGKDQLISERAQYAISYDPTTGEEIWRFYYGEDSPVSMPLYYKGLVLVNPGWVLSQGLPYFARLIALDPTGKGDITDKPVVWETSKHVPQTSSPVIVDSLLFMIEERGNMTCLNPANGAVYWEEEIKGHFNVSPICANGNIYFTNIKGETTVIKASPVYEKVTENKLDGTFKATPAILRGAILQRSDKYLYKIQSQK